MWLEIRSFQYPQPNSFQRASGLVNTWKCRESGSPGERMEAPCPFSMPCPVHLCSLAVPVLYPFRIKLI